MISLWGLLRDGAALVRARMSDDGGVLMAGDTGSAFNSLKLDANNNLKVALQAGALGVGAAPNNYAADQVTTSTTAAQAVAARAARSYVILRNLDTTISMWVGQNNTQAVPTEGMELKAGEVMTLAGTAAVHVSSASGAPVLAYLEAFYS